MTHTGFRAALLGTAALLAASLPAGAATIYTTLASWQAAIAPATSSNTTALGAQFSSTSSVSLVGGGTLSFAASTIFTIGDGWSTWSGGYTGQVLFPGFSVGSIVLSFSGIDALGFEVEPVSFGIFDVTVTLSDGTFETIGVEGASGAQFFGFADPSIVSVTISADPNASGFAFGNFYSATASVEVPAPAALALFGFGLLGFAAIRRRG